MSTALQRDPFTSPFTGRPLPANSAIAAARIAIAAAKTPEPRPQTQDPDLMQSILRPQASYRWMLPMLSAITPTYIESILRGAFAGSHIQQWELFDLMEDTWPRLVKNLNEIKRAVQSMDWQLEPWAEEDTPPTDNAKERARLVSTALWRMQPDPCCDENGFQQTIYDVLDAWGKGTSVLEILWHIRSAGQLGDITAPRATAWVRPDNYAWATDGRLGLNPQALGAPASSAARSRAYLTPSYYAQPEDVVEFPADKFLIAISKAKTGHPLCGAMLRSLAWWWCAANFSADWLMNLAQVFGLPFRWANYASGTSDATIAKICSMLENMGSAGWAAFPSGTTLELKEASKTGDNSPQGDLLDRADKNADLIILGQTLTSDTGGMGGGSGSMALGKVHAGVKDENIRAASNFAAEIINRQFIPSILRLNYGDDEEAPEFKPQPESEEDQKGNAERDAVLINAGIEMPKKWFYKRHDIPLPAAGEETISAPEQTGFGGFGGSAPQGLRSPSPQPSPPGEGEETAAGEKSAVSAKSPPDAATLGIKMDRLASAFAEDLAPIRKRLEAIITIEDPEIRDTKLRALRDSLPALLTDINADPESARVMEDALRRGVLAGIQDANKANA